MGEIVRETWTRMVISRVFICIRDLSRNYVFLVGKNEQLLMYFVFVQQ